MKFKINMLVFPAWLSMNNNDKWFETTGENNLKRAGFKKGQTVLDFGCGSGNYTIPVAKIIGERSLIYALDKDRMELDSLMSRAKSMGLTNIVRLEASGKSSIALNNKSVDVVLLYDILHYYYYQDKQERVKLLSEVYRILKPAGLLSLYPTHLDSYNEPKLADIKKEIEDADFCLEQEIRGLQMMHDGGMEKGRVINFRKNLMSVETICPKQ